MPSVSSIVASARRRGELKRCPCEVCGDARTVAHHDDYAKPLEVRWLCRSHHQAWHLRHGPGRNRPIVPSRRKRVAESPASKALQALLPGIVAELEEAGVHRTDTYRWARGATIPNAERAAKIEQVSTRYAEKHGGAPVPANGWVPEAEPELEEAPPESGPAVTEEAAS